MNISRKVKQGAAAVAGVAASGMALAAAPDTSAITTVITDYTVGAGILAVAWLVAKWAMHSYSLYRARG